MRLLPRCWPVLLLLRLHWLLLQDQPPQQAHGLQGAQKPVRQQIVLRAEHQEVVEPGREPIDLLEGMLPQIRLFGHQCEPNVQLVRGKQHRLIRVCQGILI